MKITKSLRNFSFKKSVIINNQGSELQDAQLLLDALKDIRYCIHMGIHMDIKNFFNQLYPLNPGVNGFNGVNPWIICTLITDLYYEFGSDKKVLDYSIPEDWAFPDLKITYSSLQAKSLAKRPGLAENTVWPSNYRAGAEVVMEVQIGALCIMEFTFPSADNEIL